MGTGPRGLVLERTSGSPSARGPRATSMLLGRRLVGGIRQPRIGFAVRVLEHRFGSRAGPCRAGFRAASGLDAIVLLCRFILPLHPGIRAHLRLGPKGLISLPRLRPSAPRSTFYGPSRHVALGRTITILPHRPIWTSRACFGQTSIPTGGRAHQPGGPERGGRVFPQPSNGCQPPPPGPRRPRESPVLLALGWLVRRLRTPRLILGRHPKVRVLPTQAFPSDQPALTT